MGTKEIIKEIEKLPYTERLVIIEQTLKSLRKDEEHLLEKASRLMQSEYESNKELTAFTSLDFENFYEAK